jgi:hypothetical protein
MGCDVSAEVRTADPIRLVSPAAADQTLTKVSASETSTVNARVSGSDRRTLIVRRATLGDAQHVSQSDREADRVLLRWIVTDAR